MTSTALRDHHIRLLALGLRTLAEAVRRRPGGHALASEMEALSEGAPLSAQGSVPSPGIKGPSGEAEGLAQCLAFMSRGLEEASVSAAEPELRGWADRALEALGRLARLLRQERVARLRGLYVIADPQVAGGQDLSPIVRAALEGGARAIQLRDKARDKGDQLPLARHLAILCHEHGALFIVNDHADLARACGADGVHVGQHDLPVPEARRALVPHQLVGRSNATLEEALESESQGADYIAVGAMFPSASKENIRPAGLETLRRVRRATDAPLVAIGGITEANVAEVVRAGADAVCVSAAVVAAEDAFAAARRLVTLVQEAKPRFGDPEP